VAVEAQPPGQGVTHSRPGVAAPAEGEIRGEEEDQPEDDGDGLLRHERHRHEEGADDGAESGGDLEEHAEADVRTALLAVRRGGEGGSGEDGDERSADGVAKVDVEEGDQKRDDDDTAAEPGQGAEEPGAERAEGDESGELEDGHDSRPLYGA